eukprot:CAMPEP_0206550962 /NCGR_PEP_ID=MMETSP0325_2-20121206/15274_1 /ASSEMBLY_ACC=CAM_ASM_000347 /TAXON_ID=2866 /ORGANISM="Crypthecodinium cohnii, Strain Seligo" /LENGTH=57 /DNA_ID=CAMNT_0054050699 /DNA_START=38 /DNA_END=211 /DNA_ORIENTATION=-
MTLEQGLTKTCLLPRFSALQMPLRQSRKTLMRTILCLLGVLKNVGGNEVEGILGGAP